jgi:hypothetical protein
MMNICSFCKRLLLCLAALSSLPGGLPAAALPTSTIQFLPDGRPASLILSGEEKINAQDPGEGFALRIFDGVQVSEERLSLVDRKGEQLTVTNSSGIPRFTFRIVEKPRHLSLHLVRVEGMPNDRGVSLAFNARMREPVEVVALDHMTTMSTGRGTNLVLNWPYLWNENPEDPFGAFAFYAADKDAEADLALASIWAHEPLPRPAGRESWTEADVLDWVKAYAERFAGLSEFTLSASSPEDLYHLTEKAKKAGIRRIYLHTDTWRGEYWPRHRTHVDVNPAVFPGGRADLVKYARYLHENNMQLRLHNVSGGIGWHDPERVLKSVHRELASWGGGQLEKAIGPSDTDIYFRPGAGTAVPIHDRRMRRLWQNMAVDYLRIGDEIIRVAKFADLDQPVWRLLGCQRAQGGTQATAHDAGTDGAGLYVPYRQNLVPDLNSPLLVEIAAEYAALVNEAQLDHLHFDGREIHDQHPWGWKKFTDMVYSRVNHPTTSSTSGGVPIPANFEMRFSAVRAMRELDYHGVLVPMLLAGHREATGLLDNHFVIQAMLRLGTRRLVVQKPEPMFGVTREILNNHGLAPQVLELAAQWIELLPRLGAADAAVVETYTNSIDSAFRMGGAHYENADVLVLKKQGEEHTWVPTRVMVRESGDVPWRFGQEHGAVAPKQYIQPGDNLRLINPYSEQVPEFILQVLHECVELNGLLNSVGERNKISILDDYATGAQMAGATTARPQDEPAATVKASMQPSAEEVSNQRFATYLQDGDGVVLTAKNPTAQPLWNDTDLPEWTRSFDMSRGRGLALDVTGDGSGAVLVITLVGNGMRDYVVKVDFEGTREVIIPNGEVSWASGHWGYRLNTKSFDYDSPVKKIHMGFGYIPPKTNPKVRVANLRALGDLATELRDPVIRVGEGSLQVKGSVETGDYLQYQGGNLVGVYDENWNHKADLPVETSNFIMPRGKAEIQITVSDDAPRPWISTQFITLGEPIPIAQGGVMNQQR